MEGMVEYRCKKCGQTFIDTPDETTHYMKFVEDDNQEECEGEGEVMATFPRSSIPFNAS